MHHVKVPVVYLFSKFEIIRDYIDRFSEDLTNTVIYIAEMAESFRRSTG
jgi:hypothetical protein